MVGGVKLQAAYPPGIRSQNGMPLQVFGCAACGCQEGGCKNPCTWNTADAYCTCSGGCGFLGLRLWLLCWCWVFGLLLLGGPRAWTVVQVLRGLAFHTGSQQGEARVEIPAWDSLPSWVAWGGGFVGVGLRCCALPWRVIGRSLRFLFVRGSFLVRRLMLALGLIRSRACSA